MPLFLVLLLLTACRPSALLVRTEAVTEKSLASFRVQTPDPTLDCPPIGQRLSITWAIPCWNPASSYSLAVRVRYYNYEEEPQIIPLTKKGGTYFLSLLDESYDITCGIATYRVQLIQDDCMLAEWNHPLWSELIRINP